MTRTAYPNVATVSDADIGSNIQAYGPTDQTLSIMNCRASLSAAPKPLTSELEMFGNPAMVKPGQTLGRPSWDKAPGFKSEVAQES